MSICTFFGHHDCPSSITPKLKALLENLIVNQSVDRFYVGNNGRFDFYVRRVLKELQELYPHITYHVVLSHMPNQHKELYPTEFSDTVLPDGIENVPPKFAISYRNKWMIEQSYYAVTYITSSRGGAAQFAELAKKKKKICINLAMHA